MFWWFCSGSYSSRRRDGSPISIGIMASASYTRLKGDSFVADWGYTCRPTTLPLILLAIDLWRYPTVCATILV